ncbi:hypothetical protein UFOVP153_59 [uncultured Caudovirales phage]|uniref:Uncharacterized protein n=1 Tax=uncultured Caudovirales phage TaxID=2100421 RepID=A0A6J7WFZ6_9CAUD|nr:hypothetical protein UFOVP69_64 [uncultured Caudovirales phage]CAB5171082.1 hypothetical protein UFOVP153_59 [uncultured Caudovirales phage]
MASRQDIYLVNNDCLVQNGDFVVAVSDEQHIVDTVNAFPGWWKQAPLDGIGIGAWQKGAAQIQELTRQLRIQLTSDGYTVDNPSVTISSNGQLIVNPNASI